MLILIIGSSIYVATIDGHYEIERSQLIDAPPQLLYNEINDFKNWENWGPWHEKDPDMKISYAERSKGEGASFAWQGDKGSDGSMVNQEAVKNSSILEKMILKLPFGDAESQVYWKFEPQTESGSQQTKVTLGIKGDQGFWEKAYWATKDSTRTALITPYFEKSLQKLTKTVQEKMASYSVKVDGLTDYGGGFYMYSSTASKMDSQALNTKIQRVIPQIHDFMQSNDIEISGSPMLIYNQMDTENNSAIISLGIPTPSRVVTPSEGDILCGYLQSRKVLKTTLKGNYKNLTEAWSAANKYLNQNNLQRATDASPFEVYVINATKKANPADWVTQLYIPIQEEDEIQDAVEPTDQENTNPETLLDL